MLSALSPARRRFVVAVLALVTLTVLGGLALVAGRAVSSDDPVAQGTPGPVLLVAGYGGSTASLEPVRRALEAAGRTVAVLPTVAGGTGDLDRQAVALDELADTTMAETGAGSVDVVGYSAGGVVARLWVRDHGGATKARRVLSIGSPHHGTELAELASTAGCPTACEQLVSDSDLLRALNAGDETPAGPRYISIWSTADQVVTPPTSAVLDGALDLTVQSVCPGRPTAHGDLAADPVVLAALSSTLGPGPPRVPRAVRCSSVSS